MTRKRPAIRAGGKNGVGLENQVEQELKEEVCGGCAKDREDGDFPCLAHCPLRFAPLWCFLGVMLGRLAYDVLAVLGII